MRQAAGAIETFDPGAIAPARVTPRMRRGPIRLRVVDALVRHGSTPAGIAAFFLFVRGDCWKIH